MGATVERWDIFELNLVMSGSANGSSADGPKDGNPFTDVEFGALFKQKDREVDVGGFYDGGGVYKVRFSPETEGEWTYVTRSDRDELAGKEGAVTVGPPSGANHGPVRVENQFHFAYADGTPYKQIGTTCYAWTHQGDELEEQTLASLKEAPFNKIRMCVFPKHYDYNKNEPVYYAYEKKEPAEGRKYAWDFARFDPAFWRHLELRVGQLRDLNIEADIIVFHPYDCWGFADMGREADDLYLRYLIARLASYRNVWWSMANEYDLMKNKEMSDWDRFFETFQDLDPYGRLRGIHNCRNFYDHNKPWVTHSSIQKSDLQRTAEWRNRFGKPVVVDECCYEGNNRHCWGNITGEEMLRRFWQGTCGGGYVGHGETYVNPEEVLWWSKGGKLHGTSPARLHFLRRILEEGPPEGLDPVGRRVVAACEGCAGKGDDYFLAYFGVHQPASVGVNLPEGATYKIESLDTWEMKIETVKEKAEGRLAVELPGKPYMAVRITKNA